MFRQTWGGVFILCVSVLVACGDDNGAEGSAEGRVSNCSACGADEICVRTYGEQTAVACALKPIECGSNAECFDQVCASAMYALCPEDFINTGCSDTFHPTVISCNP